ncbi:MAG: hypothetical protein AAGU02_01025, partial [Lawsonibacter sp.]
GKKILTVYLRAKCRPCGAVALRNALRISLSHDLSLRTLQREGLSTGSPFNYCLTILTNNSFAAEKDCKILFLQTTGFAL